MKNSHAVTFLCTDPVHCQIQPKAEIIALWYHHLKKQTDIKQKMENTSCESIVFPHLGDLKVHVFHTYRIVLRCH